MGWFYSITNEMIEWGLTGSELLVYALINNYSQRGQGCYWGSLDNTAEVCGISRATAIRTLQSLSDKGFLRKSKSIINDELRVIYVATMVSKCDSEYQNDTDKSIKMTPNNKVDININNTLSNKGRTRFQKPSLDEIRAYCNERGNSVDPVKFFNFYESKGWMVGKTPMKEWKASVRTWEQRPDEKKTTRQPQHKESVFARNLKVMDEMYGTNMYEEAYGKKEVCDEQ